MIDFWCECEFLRSADMCGNRFPATSSEFSGWSGSGWFVSADCQEAREFLDRAKNVKVIHENTRFKVVKVLPLGGE